MKFFTRYMPEEGEISRGDKIAWWINDKHGSVVTANDDGGYAEKYRKTKMCLCSREINVGDKVKPFIKGDIWVDAEVVAAPEVYDDFATYMLRNGIDEFASLGFGTIKVIGEIEGNEWIGEWMEFDDSQIEWLESVEYEDEPNHYSSYQEWVEALGSYKFIAIQCPHCKYFH